MNIDKGIKILTHLERRLAPVMLADGTDAIKLGIEALREVKRLRSYKAFHVVRLLEGETKE